MVTCAHMLTTLSLSHTYIHVYIFTHFNSYINSFLILYSVFPSLSRLAKILDKNFISFYDLEKLKTM